MGAPPVAGGATRASVSGRVALRCQWQKKQGISVCSGRQMRKALDADEDAGHRNRKPWGAAAPEGGFGAERNRENTKPKIDQA